MKHRSELNKLTKKELVHFIESMLENPVEEFKAMRLTQIEMRMKSSSKIEPCFECKFIAQKLGMFS